MPYFFSDADAYSIEESEDKYLVFALKNNNKKVLECTENFGMELNIKFETINGGKPIKLDLIQMMIYQ